MTHRPNPAAGGRVTRRAQTIAADAAARMRPWLVHLTTVTGLAVWTLTAVTAAAIVAAVAWHLVRWAWRAPEQPMVLALVALVGVGLYRWEQLAVGLSSEEDG